MSDLNETLAQEAAELINGGEWRDGKWYSDGQRDAWRRALKPTADRIEQLEAENKKLKSGLWSIVGLCKWGVDRTPSFCGEEESCSCIKAFNALDYDLSNSFDD